MPNLNVGLIAAVFGILFCGVANAVTGVTYSMCYEVIVQCMLHTQRNFDEYGSESATISAMCGNLTSTAKEYCSEICKYGIYAYRYLEKEPDLWQVCGVEYCGPGMYYDVNGRGTEFYYGTYSGSYNVPDCAECDYGTYQPYNQNQEGISSCQACPSGTYSSSAATDCTVCPKGTYYDEYRMLENEGYPCFPCPEFEEGDVALGSVPTSSDKTFTEQCYVPKNVAIKDSVGTWVFADDCHYVDDSGASTTNEWAHCETLNGSGNCTMTLDSVGASKLDIIKLVRSITGLGLNLAKSLVESAPATIIENFSCGAANCYAPYFSANGGARVTVTEGAQKPSQEVCESMKASGTCTMVLNSYGAEKIQTMKLVQSATGLGLKDAKALVESAPATIIENFSCEAAECYKVLFDENGDDVSVN